MRTRNLIAAALLAATGLAACAKPPVPKQDDAKANRPAPIVQPALLAEPGIQKLLELTDDQRKAMGEAVREFGKKQDEKLAARIAKLQGGQGGGIVVGGFAAPAVAQGDPTPFELRRRLQGPDSRTLVKELFEKTLKPEQVRRLGELDLQAQGPAALLDRRIIRSLGLSETQEDRIEDIKAELDRKREELNDELGFNAPGEEHWKKVETAHADAMKKCLEQLSEAQRKSWEAKTGAPAPLDQILRGTTRGGGMTFSAVGAPALRIAPAAPLAPPKAP